MVPDLPVYFSCHLLFPPQLGRCTLDFNGLNLRDGVERWPSVFLLPLPYDETDAADPRRQHVETGYHFDDECRQEYPMKSQQPGHYSKYDNIHKPRSQLACGRSENRGLGSGDWKLKQVRDHGHGKRGDDSVSG